MTAAHTHTKDQLPKLRPVDIRAVSQGGQTMLWLRDPLELAGTTVIVPRALAPLLQLCDGTRNRDQLFTHLVSEYGVLVGPDVVDQALDRLDDGLLLDNERFAEAGARVLNEYRQAPYRRPALAGLSYPAGTGELRRLLDGYLNSVDGVRPDFKAGRGLISPHIDYDRGGRVYARVWKQAAEMSRAADLAVILGTDHYGEFGRLTLTRQHYATPFGVLPTAVNIVDALAEVIGPETAFAGELRHRTEHSIELAAIWLHHIRGGRPVELLPILCGSFAHFIQDDTRPESDPTLNAVLETLRQKIAGRQVLIVAAGDLAHIGPAFGGQPVDRVGRAWLQVNDNELIEQICTGGAEGFFSIIKRERDRNNVCGVSPIYLALRLMNASRGERAGYDRCPADPNNTSFVSVCGIVFR